MAVSYRFFWFTHACELPSFLIYARLRYSFVSDLRTPTDFLYFRSTFCQRACSSANVSPASLPVNESVQEPTVLPTFCLRACLPINEPAFRQRFVCKETADLSTSLRRACISPIFRQRVYQWACQQDYRHIRQPACLSTCLPTYLPVNEPAKSLRSACIPPISYLPTHESTHLRNLSMFLRFSYGKRDGT
jgi:hypothetical protein